ncbi:uncharacterized protein LOC128956140 [Oppia nitens]|uniref:uncharacterized protein LOC128956140 n=1 Tax=Oppia nitens TaxID=1686743 RepID=UPI0023DC7DAA|nr:uncharacterized protein LOC128956140 [Oppia nitens]
MNDTHIETLTYVWFNLYGAILSMCDIILAIFGALLMIISVVNDSNSDIISDINYYYHFGMNYAAILLFVASYSGFTGFIEESVNKLILSPSLMICVTVILCKLMAINYIYGNQLSHLVNSFAELSFEEYMSDKSNPDYQFGVREVMRAYKCCGWDKHSINELKFGRNLSLLPCECCRSNQNSRQFDYELCTSVELLLKTDNQSVYQNTTKFAALCPSTHQPPAIRFCSQVLNTALSDDLKWQMGFFMTTFMLSILSIVLSFRLSYDLVAIDIQK